MKSSIAPAMRAIAFFLVALWSSIAAAAPLRAEVALVMVEQHGCVYCERWNEDIGPAYPRTREGEIAPLKRVNIRERNPEGVEFARPVVFTPTFVLLRDGEEVGRIEGYPGDEFFWFLLQRLMIENNLATAEDFG